MTMPFVDSRNSESWESLTHRLSGGGVRLTLTNRVAVELVTEIPAPKTMDARKRAITTRGMASRFTVPNVIWLHVASKLRFTPASKIVPFVTATRSRCRRPQHPHISDPNRQRGQGRGKKALLPFPQAFFQYVPSPCFVPDCANRLARPHGRIEVVRK